MNTQEPVSDANPHDAWVEDAFDRACRERSQDAGWLHYFILVGVLLVLWACILSPLWMAELSK